jgi:hypothetical protein
VVVRPVDVGLLGCEFGVAHRGSVLPAGTSPRVRAVLLP